MQRITILILLLTALSVKGQKNFPLSMYFPLGKEFPVVAEIGNDCGQKDINCQFNTTDGTIDLVVKKQCHSWSYLQHWMSGNSPSIVFKRRYIEFRIISTQSHSSDLFLNFVVTGSKYNPNGSIGKFIPQVNYTISRPDEWEIKSFELGGTADTVFGEIEYNFPDGNYRFDYIYYGISAVPPIPSIHQLDDQEVMEEDTKLFPLDSIEIKGRSYDGLIIKAETKGMGVLEDVGLLDFTGTGDYIDQERKTAWVRCKGVSGAKGNSDSIIITLEDTIRKTMNRMAFQVKVTPKAYKLSGIVYAGGQMAQRAKVYLLDKSSNYAVIDSNNNKSGYYQFFVIRKKTHTYCLYAKPSDELKDKYHVTYLGNVPSLKDAFNIDITSEMGSVDINLLTNSEVGAYDESSSLAVFPNPAKDFFTVTGLPSSGAQLEIVNLTGEQVMSFFSPAETFQVNTSELPNGIYILKISSFQCGIYNNIRISICR